MIGACDNVSSINLEESVFLSSTASLRTIMPSSQLTATVKQLHCIIMFGGADCRGIRKQQWKPPKTGFPILFHSYVRNVSVCLCVRAYARARVCRRVCRRACVCVCVRCHQSQDSVKTLNLKKEITNIKES